MGRVLAAVAILLLILSVRTVLIGYDSYTPLVFAQLYIDVFALGMTIPVFRRMNRSAAGDHVVLLLVAGAVAAYYFGLLAWNLGGTTYCGGRYILSSVVRVPSVYRCASNPAAAAGGLAGLWIAIWIIEWWSDRMNVDSDSDFTPKRSFLPTVGFVLAVGLLIVAIGTMFVGTSKFRPILFAEMYVLLFALFVAVPTALRAGESDAGWFLLFSVALFGALLAWKQAPQIEEPNFCSPLPVSWRALRDLTRDIGRLTGAVLPPLVRPHVFRCTSMPFSVIGGFTGWWIVFFASGRRKAVALS
jgi:hypothetical protein